MTKMSDIKLENLHFDKIIAESGNLNQAFEEWKKEYPNAKILEIKDIHLVKRPKEITYSEYVLVIWHDQE